MKSPFLRRFGMPSPFFDNEAGFSPTVLLAGSTAFMWLDPSDLTTMFQDSAGTTPVTAPAQPVGLVLDKSQGLVLGPELVTNGDFSSGSTGWSAQTGWTIGSGVASVNSSAAGSTYLRTSGFSAVAGSYYRVTFTVTSYTSGSIFAAAGTSGGTASATAVGTYTFLVQASGSGGVGLFAFGNNTIATVDNISVRELPGFHATQSTAATRPTYGVVPSRGRVNLLTFTEQFDNAAWGKTANLSVTANFDTAPDGTNTADRFVSTGGSFPQTAQSVSGLVAGQSYTFSVWVKSDGTAQTAQSILLESGVTTFTPTSTWTRVSVTVASSAGGSRSAVIATNSGTAAASSFLIWGAQLETGSTATPYQRVVSQFEVTDPAGFPSYQCHYLSFDGVDDFLVTPTITPNADKVQVFAGVRKLSDALLGIVAELSTTIVNSGSFAVFAPSASPSLFSFRSRGTLVAVANATAPSAPTTVVFTGLSDISGDRASLRLDGTEVAEILTDQGTGNYLAYPLYIGRRNGTSNPFNGQLFQLITRFSTANLDAGLVSQTERFVGQKTGVTI